MKRTTLKEINMVIKKTKFGDDFIDDFIFVKTFFDNTNEPYIITINDKNDITVDRREVFGKL